MHQMFGTDNYHNLEPMIIINHHEFEPMIITSEKYESHLGLLFPIYGKS